MFLSICRPRFLASVLCVGVLLCSGAGVQAATFCVGSSSELQAALTAAGGNGQSDDIRIRTSMGLPTAPAQPGVTYVLNIEDGRDVHVSGGWTNPTCTSSTSNAFLTQLAPHGHATVLRVNTPPDQDPSPKLSLRRLTLTTLNIRRENVSACAAEISADLDVELDAIMVREVSCSGVGLLIALGGGELRIVNSVFADNSLDYPLFFGFAFGGQRIGSVLLANNTIAFNSIKNSEQLDRLLLEPAAIARIENTLFWANRLAPPDSPDFHRPLELALYAAPGSFRNNHIQSDLLSGPFLDLNTHNSSGAPRLLE